MRNALLGKIFFSALIFSIFLAALPENCSANTISCHVDGAQVGPYQDGQQLIVFEATFKNISGQEYVDRVNHVEVEVHGFFNGREEKYTRKVDVNWNFSPPLGPGERKGLKIKFYRSVQPQRGSYPYNGVQIKVLNINFKRAS